MQIIIIGLQRKLPKHCKSTKKAKLLHLRENEDSVSLCLEFPEHFLQHYKLSCCLGELSAFIIASGSQCSLLQLRKGGSKHNNTRGNTECKVISNLIFNFVDHLDLYCFIKIISSE